MMDYKKLTAAVERAAAIAASKFPAHHDISDVKQELWVWIMEKKTFVNERLSQENGEQSLINIMVKVGQSALLTEDAQTYGYSEEDQFNYPLDMIKSILEVVFKHEDWQSFAQSQDGMPRAKSEPALGGNNLASYADVSRAVESLPEDQYNVLVWRYKYHYTFQQIADESGLTNQGAQNRHSAAVAAIQQYLGKRDLSGLRRGWEGRTEPRTTASAVAVTERDYEG
jgi:DNA-directed RNA polymerase specialized sigma24 family protein